MCHGSHNSAESSQNASSSLKTDQSLEKKMADARQYHRRDIEIPCSQLHSPPTVCLHNVTCRGCQKMLSTKKKEKKKRKRHSWSTCQEWLPQGVEWLPPSGLNIPSNESIWENNLKSHSLRDWKHLGLPAVCVQTAENEVEDGTLTPLNLHYKQTGRTGDKCKAAADTPSFTF